MIWLISSSSSSKARVWWEKKRVVFNKTAPSCFRNWIEWIESLELWWNFNGVHLKEVASPELCHVDFACPRAINCVKYSLNHLEGRERTSWSWGHCLFSKTLTCKGISFCLKTLHLWTIDNKKNWLLWGHDPKKSLKPLQVLFKFYIIITMTSKYIKPKWLNKLQKQ